jgi:uncharacterized protein (TIGR02996 family)
MGAAGRTGEHGLQQAVAKNPRDAAVRLVYADWLEEHGEPDGAKYLRVSAEFIRLWQGDPNENPLRYVELRARMRRLRPALDPDWLKAIRDPGLVGDILHAAWGSGVRFNGFYVVIKETAKKVWLVSLSTRRSAVNRNGKSGTERPVLPTATKMAILLKRKKILAQKRLDEGSGEPYCFGTEQLFRYWDGKDQEYTRK